MGYQKYSHPIPIEILNKMREHLKIFHKSKMFSPKVSLQMEVDFFSMLRNSETVWVNFDIINNDNTVINNIIEAPLTEYDVMGKYPLELELFDNDNFLREKFVKILNNHRIMDIVDYIDFPNHRRYKNGKIYHLNKEISETELYFYFADKSIELFEKHIEYYTKHKDIPIKNSKNYNEHIIVNYKTLILMVKKSEKDSLIFLFEKIKIEG